MTHGRRAAGLVLATALAASLTACGGSDDPTTSGPASATSSATPSESASATPSASPTPTTEPLSRFEDDPAVQGARAWAAAIAKDINAKDSTFAATAPLSTAAARKDLASFTEDEFSNNLTYPGALPFTPVRLRAAGATTTVVTCAWAGGWGIDPATHQPKDEKSIRGEDFVMTRTASGYVLKDFVEHPGLDCSGVTVKGIAG